MLRLLLHYTKEIAEHNTPAQLNSKEIIRALDI
jgi:hypothetical protein